jgi:nitrite reductase/ring-hydroxylating ferredoxin subunit
MSALTNFFKSVFGICETPELAPDKWRIEGDTIRIDLSETPQLTADGGAVYLNGKELPYPVLVFKQDSSYLAVSNRCTHMGRKIDPVPGKPELRCCSVSHSRYDLNGNVISGPASGSLDRYEVILSGEALEIRLRPTTGNE